MITADRVLVVVGLAIVLLALSSRLVKRHALSPVVLALAAGVLVGPHALAVLDPTTVVPRGELLEQTARVALALAVFDITLRVGPRDLLANRRRIAVLLLVVMPGMWLVTALGANLLLGLPLGLALLLGAALTPTDPAAASSLVTGVLPDQSLPRRVRASLQVESAANDGLALPFVLLAGLLVSVPIGDAVGPWLLDAGRQVGIALAVGTAVGLAMRWLTDLAGVDRLAEEDWFPLASTGVALSVLGLAHLLGGTGVLAAFAAGLTFSEGLPEGTRKPIHVVHRSVAKVGLVVVFLVFGTVLPVDRWWPELGWGGVLFALWVLLLRRFPVTFPALLATGTGRLSSGFMAWSGPLGVAGIYYLAFAETLHVPQHETLFAAGSLAVTVSIVGQALSASPAVHGYRRRTGQVAPEGEELEIEGRLP